MISYIRKISYNKLYIIKIVKALQLIIQLRMFLILSFSFDLFNFLLIPQFDNYTVIFFRNCRYLSQKHGDLPIE